MQIYFLRHGLADRNEWDGEDSDRPLTTEGLDRMFREAETLDEIGLNLDVLLTSPLVRARQTAEIVADVLDLHDCIKEEKRLQPGFGVEELMEIVRDNADAKRIMVVGHEPDFSTVIGSLIGGGGVVCKKGGLVRVDITRGDKPRGELVWLIPPKLLARNGSSKARRDAQ